MPNDDDTTSAAASGTTQSTNWTAPTTPGSYTLTCTIDDEPLEVGALDTGSRNDDRPLVRTVSITVEPAPSVVFSGELTKSGTLRACAGGFDDVEVLKDGLPDPQYRAHKRFVTATARNNGQPATALALHFAFKGNKGHDYGQRDAEQHVIALTARFLSDPTSADSEVRWKETLARATDAAGKIDLTVKSSDVINEPTLQVFWTNGAGHDVLVGSISCDFDGAETLRRGVNPVDPADTYDTGWIFNSPQLREPGDSTPAKVYLKFKKDKDGTDDDGNWNYVNGHHMAICVGEVDLADSDETGLPGTALTTLPDQLKNFAFVTSAATGQAQPGEIAADRVTSGDGATPQVYVFAGPDIGQAEQIKIDAFDLTQWPQ